MKTKTIGEILREERELYRLSLSDLSKRTKIKEKYLAHLERDEFDQLPGATYIKGYLKNLSYIYRSDYEALVAILRRDYKESATGRLVPREFLKSTQSRRNLWTPVNLSALAVGMVFLVLISYVGVQYVRLNRPPQLTITEPKENDKVAAEVKVRGKTDPEATLSVNNQPVGLQINGNFETTIFLAREGKTTISVEATNRRGKSTIEQRTVEVEY